MANNINLTLEDLAAAFSAMADCCKAGGEVGGQYSDDGVLAETDVPIGEGERFETQTEYQSAKCNAANSIYDTLKAQFDWLVGNHADLFAGTFGGITAGLAIHFALGPLGWATFAVELAVTAIAAYLIAYNVSFVDVQGSLDNKHGDIVQSLYNASTATQAEDNFINSLTGATPGIGSTEEGLIRLMLPNKLLNQLFSPSAETALYQSANPTVCSAIQTWSFAASGEGWTFADESDGSNSASGSWDSGDQSWQIDLVNAGFPPSAAWGAIYIDGLSISIGVNDAVQVDYSAPSDGVNMSVNLTVIYSDMSEFTGIEGNTSTAGTLTVQPGQAGTIEEIRVNVGRQAGLGTSWDVDILEVRVQ